MWVKQIISLGTNLLSYRLEYIAMWVKQLISLGTNVVSYRLEYPSKLV